MIRMIEEKDIPVILAWYNRYILESEATFETEPLSLAEFAERVHKVTERYPWIVLEEDGVLKGYAYLSSFNQRAAYDWTADLAIYVDPGECAKGYGSQLMEALLQTAAEDGYHNIISIITDSNTASIAIHRKFGFENKGTFPLVGYKFKKWLSVSYWQKTLAQGTDDEEPAAPYRRAAKGKEKKMIKVYGHGLCPDCMQFKANLDAYGIAYEYADIQNSLPDLKAFLKIRDAEAVFDEPRQSGGIGIPAIVKEDGTVTLDWQGWMKNAGYEPMLAGHTACRLDGTGC